MFFSTSLKPTFVTSLFKTPKTQTVNIDNVCLSKFHETNQVSLSSLVNSVLDQTENIISKVSSSANEILSKTSALINTESFEDVHFAEPQSSPLFIHEPPPDVGHHDVLFQPADAFVFREIILDNEFFMALHDQPDYANYYDLFHEPVASQKKHWIHYWHQQHLESKLRNLKPSCFSIAFIYVPNFTDNRSIMSQLIPPNVFLKMFNNSSSVRLKILQDPFNYLRSIVDPRLYPDIPQNAWFNLMLLSILLSRTSIGTFLQIEQNKGCIDFKVITVKI